MVQEKIEIVGEFINHISKTAKAAFNTLKTLEDGTQRLTENTFKYNESNKKVKTILDKTHAGLMTNAQSFDAMNKLSKKSIDSLQKHSQALKTTSSVSKNYSTVSKTIGNMASEAGLKVNDFKEQIRKSGATLKDVATPAMEASNETLLKSKSAQNVANDGLVTLNSTTKKSTKGASKFNFAWLSVMFAGMALDRVFGGLIKSQLKLFGITDLFGGVLTLIMLPIMMVLLPFFLWLSEIFMNLSPEIKTVIGVFIVLGALFGIVLLVVGQLALAVQGIGSIFGWVGKAAWAGVWWIIVILVGLGFIIAGVIIIVKNWGKDWAKVMEGAGYVAIGLGLVFLAVMKIMVISGVAASKIIWMAFAWKILLIVGAIAFLTKWWIDNWDESGYAFRLIMAQMQNNFANAFNWMTNIAEKALKGIRELWNKFVPEEMRVEPAVDLSKFKAKLIDMNALRDKLAKQRWSRQQTEELKSKGFAFTKEGGFVKEISDSLDKLPSSKDFEGIMDKNMPKIDMDKISPKQDLEEIFPKNGTQEDFLKDILPEEYKGMMPGVTPYGPQQEININNNNTFNVSDKEEMQKMIDENNIKTVDEIKRQIGV